MTSTYTNHLLAVSGPDAEPDSDEAALDRFHDAALLAFVTAARDLVALDPLHWTVARLREKLTRHLTSEVVPYPEAGE